ncbi:MULTISPECIES: DoxX family membrane protein [Micromonospora]|uniref:DoxX family membrane protein n=1 Tax=Micromonospora solifontis TaxID=2487138 RepID=A0ABX9WMP1_9ACTN|nr:MULTISPECIES: DoxX family membrane protein [Micromonospora]NES14368.1 DoxX family membrane protein [Micromonospora sp. PPF5-17B]NES35024.1 DoxX family membrane protein [Micromonospora solifontis]NES57475.1 DoxX family membrane protein [Micromonospora sp. PPF5-6]RNM01295.1 DoxX family membrane protein [Micromonospora solifontis]
MAPLIALLTGTAVARIAGLLGVDALDGWLPALRIGLALMFVLTGVAHFASRRADLIAMVPPALPRPDLLVTVTGVLELGGALALLAPATARWAAAGLALLMLAMFPANVSAARRRLTLAGRPVTPLGARTVLQIVFVAAALAIAFGG